VLQWYQIHFLLGVETAILQFINEFIEYKNTKEFIVNLNLLFVLKVIQIIRVLEILLILQWAIIILQWVIEALEVNKVIIVKVLWVMENMIEIILYLINKLLWFKIISKIKLFFI
jgi:hypothetical protein